MRAVDRGRGVYLSSPGQRSSSSSSPATAAAAARNVLWAKYSISAHALATILVLFTALALLIVGAWVAYELVCPICCYFAVSISQMYYIAYMLRAATVTLHTLNPIAVYDSLKGGTITYECSYGGSLLNILECDIKNGFNRLLVSTVEQVFEMTSQMFKMRNVPHAFATLVGIVTITRTVLTRFICTMCKWVYKYIFQRFLLPLLTPLVLAIPAAILRSCDAHLVRAEQMCLACHSAWDRVRRGIEEKAEGE
jgi:hypothetical protein